MMSNNQFGQEMLTLFIQQLPGEFDSICAAKQSRNYKLLHQRLHKLHGAVAYCNLPHLIELIKRLEMDLKNKDYTQLVPNFDLFATAIRKILGV
jgi:HPt (histidine-containing phosphotransfer) domain-containing protein